MKSFSTTLKEKFNYDVSAIGTYVDEQSENIMIDVIYGSGLVDRIQVMENVKGSERIKLLNVEFELQSAEDCEMEDDGTVIFTQKTMVTKPVGVQMSLCNKTLNGTWAQMLLAIGANRQNREMPLEDVISLYVIKMARLKNQNLMFKGDTTLSISNPELAFYDGFFKLWNNSSLITIAPRIGGNEITSSNAFENFKSVYKNIPGELFDNGIPVEIICSRKAAYALIDQVWNDKDFNAKIETTDVNGELSFKLPTTDITVRTYPQFAGDNENDIYAVPYQFMFFGTDLEGDIDGFIFEYLTESKKLRFGAEWRSGVQWVFEDKFVRLSENVS